MPGALRIRSITLPVPDPAPVAKFYRWVLAAKPLESPSSAGIAVGWDGGDAITFVDGAGEEAVTLVLPAMTREALESWLAERSLPGELREADGRATVALQAPAEPAIELDVPLNGSSPADGLEVPGLLGVTTGAGDPGAERAFLARLGIDPLDSGAPDGPLRVGDQQWIVERREPAGIYGLAVVVEASRVKDIARTLEKLGAEFRHDGPRIVALDPAGRVLLIHGLRGG